MSAGQGIKARQVYSRPGSGSSYMTGSESRTSSASSYTSVTSTTSYSTDSRAVSSRLPVITTAQPKAVSKSVTQTGTSTSKAPYRGRPVSSGSDSASGSESSYSSSSSGER